ncbi:thioesterase II family protein [Catenulispora pinisilvae]|uniref:thioesterase II family protein n=1 Tax=Catenulispora pinisilvae TaxID=2705253 RepID=UPI0018911FBF|nr:alpha/beta fold hydrolase [Catenulispora pinisilvae]
MTTQAALDAPADLPLRRLGPVRAPDGEADQAVLVCFPHAGAGATAFASWQRRVPDWLALYGYVAPGREDRSARPPLDSVQALADDILPALLALPGRICLLGHSFGAHLAYELAYRMTRRGRAVDRLVVLAAPVPRPEPAPALGDPEIEELWRRLGGDPARLRRQDFRDRVFPALRADLAAGAAYHLPASRPPLAIGVTALYGLGDPEVTGAAVRAWQAVSSSPIEVAAIPGGHYFPQTEPEATLNAVLRALGSRHLEK